MLRILFYLVAQKLLINSSCPCAILCSPFGQLKVIEGFFHTRKITAVFMRHYGSCFSRGIYATLGQYEFSNDTKRGSYKHFNLLA